MNATQKCDDAKQEVILLSSRAILTFELHCSVEVELLQIELQTAQGVYLPTGHGKLVELELAERSLRT